MEDGSRDTGDIGEDVTGAGRVFTALRRQYDSCRSTSGATHSNASTELTVGIEQVDVVAADKVLSKTDNGHCKTDIAVVVCRFLRDITGKLLNLDLLDEVTLEASEQNLALTGLESICN
jgi:hypothetical protein